LIFIYRARVVPENILKKQARDQKLAQTVKDKRVKDKADRVVARTAAKASASKYFKEYQEADLALIKAKRDAKAAGNFFVEGQAKVAFVMRIRG
jgi:large subunit ribosomal protein L7e